MLLCGISILKVISNVSKCFCMSGMQGGCENHQFGSSHASLSLAQSLHWPGD